MALWAWLAAKFDTPKYPLYPLSRLSERVKGGEGIIEKVAGSKACNMWYLGNSMKEGSSKEIKHVKSRLKPENLGIL